MKALLVDGKLCSSFSLHPCDPSWKWGMGFFTTLKVETGELWFLSSHVEKLKQACSFASLPFPQKFSLFESWAKHLIKSAEAYKGIWRLKITILWDSRVVMTLEEEKKATKKELDVWLYPQAFYSYLAAYKSLSYMDRYLLMQKAREHNCHEILTLDTQSFLLEGAYSNIFWIDKQHFYTPSSKLCLYEGTTLTACMQWARLKGYAVHRGSYSLCKLLKSEAAFMCNSMKGIRAIKRLFIKDKKHQWPSAKAWADRFNKALKNQHQSQLQKTNKQT